MTKVLHEQIVTSSPSAFHLANTSPISSAKLVTFVQIYAGRRPLPYVIPRPRLMICQASACALIIPNHPLACSDTAVCEHLCMGRTMLNAVMNHLYIMATDRSVEKEKEER